MHEELAIYDEILENWDYRSYEKWEMPEHQNALYLNPEEWLSEHPDYIYLESNIETLVEMTIAKVTRQLEEFKPYLVGYWENLQIQDFKNVTNIKLKNPLDVIPLLLRRFEAQSESITQIPKERDIGMLSVNFTEIVDVLTPNPKKCLAKLKQLLPAHIKTLVSECIVWMKEQVRLLEKMPENVDEFVRQIKCLEYTEANFQEVKEKLEFCDGLYAICDSQGLISREIKHSIHISEAYVLTNTLTNAVYSTKDKTEAKKDKMKKITFQKIPVLKKQVEKLTEMVAKPELLEFEFRDETEQQRVESMNHLREKLSTVMELDEKL